MGFRKLYLKECRSILPLYSVMAVLILIWHFFVWYKSTSWNTEVVMVTSLALPWILLTTISIGLSYYQLHTEWKSNAIYFLMSLPIRGWKVICAKLAASYSLMITALLWTGCSFALILLRTRLDELKSQSMLSDALPTLLNMAFNSFWMYSLYVLFLLAAVQFAYLCGELVAKLKWLVVLAALVGMLWLSLRATSWLSQPLQWTPDIRFGGSSSEIIYLNSGPFVVLTLMLGGLIWLNGYLFEKEVEV